MAGLRSIPLPGAELAFNAAWLSSAQADALFAALHETIAWEAHRIRLFGREVNSPRLSCWIGDPGAAYTYSGTHFAPRPWPGALRPIRKRMADELGVDFNSVLANLYRDGRDAMGWHSDDERELGVQPVIASLSLGATRRFVLKARAEAASSGLRSVAAKPLALELSHGSLLVMRGETQAHYRHALPRTVKLVGPRINLTFRRIMPSGE